jgi:hypothetical protein
MFTSLTGLPACLELSSCRSVLNHAVFHIAALIATTARCVTSRLRHFSAGSPQYLAETGSSSYGPTVRFRLLPTSSHDDAVTFGYGAVANSDRDLHPANSTLSRAYTKPLRGRAYCPAPRLMVDLLILWAASALSSFLCTFARRLMRCNRSSPI